MKKPDTIMINGRAHSWRWRWILELRRTLSGADLAGPVAGRGSMGLNPDQRGLVGCTAVSHR